jgi:hypothetical protein
MGLEIQRECGFTRIFESKRKSSDSLLATALIVCVNNVALDCYAVPADRDVRVPRRSAFLVCCVSATLKHARCVRSQAVSVLYLVSNL